MKSYGQLWERIVSPDNLKAALGRVTKGRGCSAAVMAFASRADGELEVLREELASGTWQPGPYGQFRVTDPKPRTISCAPVRDRVVHHALCGVIAPLLERGFTEDCYACRVGKGTHRAAARARELVRRHGWTCKLDIRRYFDSVPHGRLLELLLPMFREKEVCRVIEVIVRHPVPGLPSGRGLPIGNLTSQWFANFHLSGLDHYAKEVLLAPGYIRYMDDMVLFADSKAELWRLHDGVCAWVADERGLEVKGERTVVAPVTEGLAFLGLRIFSGGWRFQRARLLRTRRKFRLRERQYQAGEIDGRKLAMCAAAADGGSRWYGFKGILQSSGLLEDERIWAGGEGAESGSNRVNRGGSWNNTASNCRSAYRNSNTPSNRNNNNGFRLVSTMQ
ncbi:MAG: reverse transcriptase domain-containing protein [bacterium]